MGSDLQLRCAEERRGFYLQRGLPTLGCRRPAGRQKLLGGRHQFFGPGLESQPIQRHQACPGGQQRKQRHHLGSQQRCQGFYTFGINPLRGQIQDFGGLGVLPRRFVCQFSGPLVQQQFPTRRRRYLPERWVESSLIRHSEGSD